jgi:segregation and condensation protein B
VTEQLELVDDRAMGDGELDAALEALLLVVDAPTEADALAAAVEQPVARVRAALETLAVIAYRQPVTRARVSAVRGVNCDGVLRTLVSRGLVAEAGTDPATQGTLFATTEMFLERLGLSSLEDLPPLAPLLPDVDAIDDV